MTAITGETGAGKTLIVDALELLCGGRADPQPCATAPTKRVSRVASSSATTSSCWRGSFPRDGRSRGYIDGRLATAAELAERRAHLVDLHGQHAHQSLLAPAEQRALLDRVRRRARPAAALRAVARCARIVCAPSMCSWPRRAATNERAPARSTSCATSSTRSTPPAIADVDEDARLSARNSCSPTPKRIVRRSTRRTRALEGAAIDALGAAVAALAGRAPFTVFADRLRVLQAEIAEAAHDVRDTAESVIADPERLDDAASAPRAAARVDAQVRADARRRRDLWRRIAGSAHRARRARHACGRARPGAGRRA